MSALPERFGKYHVLSPLAQGGMAEIYRVKTIGIAGFEKLLALKRIRPQFAREPRFIRSFIDEARIAVSLNHRNIVQVFDFGRAGDELYLAMELIEGVDLHSAIADAAARGQHLPIALTCYILGELAGCLDYAHRKRDVQRRPLNIVHCDISPHNVMLSYEGFVKILDFGVARARFSITPRTRRIRGKPRYMAPEQARCETPTAATDVFALATVAWELLTGLPLFEGRTVKEILASVRRADAPAVHKLNPDVPQPLSDAIDRALSVDAAARGTAGHLAAAFAGARRMLDPGVGSRALSQWMQAIYPEVYAVAPAAEEPALAEDATGVEIPSLRASQRLEWAADEVATAVTVEPLEAPALEALVDKRRVVAVAARLDCPHADARHELLGGIAQLAYKHGAVIYERRDDDVVAIFGLEVAGEDDVAHAMGFCLDAGELVRESAAEGGATLRLAARAGITAQRRSDGTGYQLVGDAVEEARALARDAQPGRPLLAGSAGRLASASYSLRELPARKPRSRRLRVLELLGPRTFDERDRALRERRGAFVGRGDELAAIDRAWERARREQRRVAVAVVGAAGVGKSRLVAEFVGRLPERDPDERRLVAVAVPAGGRDAPYSLIVELFQASLNLPPGRGESARARLIQRLRYVLGQASLVPDQVNELIGAVEEAMELRDGLTTRQPAAAAAGSLRDRVAAALHAYRRTVAVPAAQQINVLEDVHYIDGASAAVLRNLVARHARGPELLVLTSRDRAAGDLLADAVDFVIELPELSPDEREALIRHRLAEASDEAAVAAVARRAGGNPLFIEELAVAVREAGADQIPNSAREVILARVDRLHAGAKSALQHAAVAGPTFRTRLLEELLGSRIHKELEYLCEEGLLQRADHGSVSASEGELTFAHGLIQEVVYDALAVRARRETHARLGHLLASRYRAGREEPPAAIARHFEHGGEPSSAATYWLRAGHVALAAHEPTDARDAFTRALALDDDSPDVAAGVRRTRRRDAISGRERAHQQLGDHDAQLRDLLELEKLSSGEPKRLADTKNRAAARLLRLGEYDAAVAASGEAERHARSARDQLGRGEALRLRGEAFERLCQFDRALDAVSSALEIFRSGGAVHQETRALIGIGRVHLFASRYEDAREAYGPALERVLEAGDPWLERTVRNNISVIHLCLGDYARAFDEAHASLEICRQYGDRARLGDNLAVCGTILMFVGQFERARADLEEALAIHGTTGSRWSRADGLVYAGTTALHQDRLADAMGYLDEACALAVELGVPYIEANGQVARASALLARAGDGDVELATVAARRAIELSQAATLVGTEIEGHARLAAARHAAGDLAAALAASDHAVALLERQRFIEGSEQEVWFTHYRLLEATGSPDANEYLRRAHDELMRKLALLPEPNWRASFLQGFAVHRRIDDEYSTPSSAD